MRQAVIPAVTLASLIALASGCLAEEGDYSFVGMWDCEIAVLTFTNETYHDGTNEYPMTEVAEDNGEFVVTLTADYIIGLSGIKADKMTFAPMVGGDLFACFRLE